MNLSFLLLGLWIGLAGLGFWFGFARPVRFLRSLPQAVFFISTFILVPATAFVIWEQASQTGSLQSYDIPPHPALERTTSSTTGTGESPLWVFRASADAQSIVLFYRKRANRPGWELKYITPVQIVLRRKGQELIISAQDHHQGSIVTYLLREP
ncbi:MAG: hypothetical protein ACLFQR_06610 [Desulfovibrionales bacterium]